MSGMTTDPPVTVAIDAERDAAVTAIPAGAVDVETALELDEAVGVRLAGAVR